MVKDYCETEYGITPQTELLIASKANLYTKIKIAANKNLTAVTIRKTLISQNVVEKCAEYGLGIGEYDFSDTFDSYKYLYKHLITDKYKVYGEAIIDEVISDGKIFN